LFVINITNRKVVSEMGKCKAVLDFEAINKIEVKKAKQNSKTLKKSTKNN